MTKKRPQALGCSGPKDCYGRCYIPPALRLRPPVKPSKCGASIIAVNIAKLPSVPRQILKDIPRPPNTASRDDCAAGGESA